MMQFLEANACGIIGAIEPLNGSGLKVVVFVNKIDQYGQQVGSQKINVVVFNDAERIVLKNNARAGDTMVIRNGYLEINQNQDPNAKHKFSTVIRCNWYNQVSIISGTNHQTLMNRSRPTTA